MLELLVRQTNPPDGRSFDEQVFTREKKVDFHNRNATKRGSERAFTKPTDGSIIIDHQNDRADSQDTHFDDRIRFIANTVALLLTTEYAQQRLLVCKAKKKKRLKRISIHRIQI